MRVCQNQTKVCAVDKIDLTILMPCLNEAETIENCIQKAIAFITRCGVRGEILIADNGSTDGSADLALGMGARVVAVAQRGYGAALRAGIHAARGRYVIMGDADDSYDFVQLDDFLAKLRDGCDLVIGNRMRGGIAPGAMPSLHRYLGNPLLSLLGRIFFHVNVGDFHCGLRGFNRKKMLALHLHTSGMEFASEMVIASALKNYVIAEVPTTLQKDSRSRPSHLRTWSDGWRHLRFMLMFSPRWLFLYPALALILFGLVCAIFLFPGPLQLGGIVLDIHTFIVAAISILVGVQIISFGLVAHRFGTANGFLPEPKYLWGVLSALTLERGLIVAGVVVAAGFVGVTGALLKWASVNFGPLTYPLMMRVLVLSLTAIASGLQLAFTSFLLGIMDLPLQRDAAAPDAE